MKNFIYNAPTKVVFGVDSEKKLVSLIKEGNYRKVLFHYGKSSIKKLGLYDFILSMVQGSYPHA